MKNPAHPGRILAAAIESLGWSIEQAASQLDIEPTSLSQFLEGQNSLDAKLAIRLESLGWSDADHWMRMQAGFDLAEEINRREC